MTAWPDQPVRQVAAAALALAVVAVLLGGVAPDQAAAADDDCPDPRTCPNYRLLFPDTKARWQPDPDGITRIPFYVNPTSAFMSPEEAVEVVLLAAATWEAYLPTVRFEYLGETTQPAYPPGYPGADKNIVQLAGVTPMAVIRASSDYRWIVGFSVMMNVWNSWVRCDPFADDSCTRVCSGTPCMSRSDTQAGLMHELGHVLGLDHAPRPSCELTMQGSTSTDPGCTSNNRKASTPGLGDVLGLHELYPFTCPTEYETEEEALRYQYVCPTVRVFYP